MRKNRIYIYGLLFLLSLSASACFSNVKSKGISNKPDTSVSKNIEIDWEQVRQECEDVMISDNYPLVSYIDFAISDVEGVNKIRLILPLKNEATQVESLEYASSYIKEFNDVVRNQDFSIKPSGENYYGGLWEKYELEIEVYKEEDILFPEKYYVNQFIDSPDAQENFIIPYISDLSEEEQNKAQNQVDIVK